MYVFDDADPENAVYLGMTKVPLITIANDKPIRGTFELRKVSGLGLTVHVMRANQSRDFHETLKPIHIISSNSSSTRG